MLKSSCINNVLYKAVLSSSDSYTIQQAQRQIGVAFRDIRICICANKPISFMLTSASPSSATLTAASTSPYQQIGTVICKVGDSSLYISGQLKGMFVKQNSFCQYLGISSQKSFTDVYMYQSRVLYITPSFQSNLKLVFYCDKPVSRPGIKTQTEQVQFVLPKTQDVVKGVQCQTQFIDGVLYVNAGTNLGYPNRVDKYYDRPDIQKLLADCKGLISINGNTDSCNITSFGDYVAVTQGSDSADTLTLKIGKGYVQE